MSKDVNVYVTRASGVYGLSEHIEQLRNPPPLPDGLNGCIHPSKTSRPGSEPWVDLFVLVG